MASKFLQTQQIVVFQGLPASLGPVSARVLQKGPNTMFLCLLEPDQSAEEIRRIWDRSIQPDHPLVHLYILREQKNRQIEAIVEFCEVRFQGQVTDLDVLCLSEASGLRETRHLAKWLKLLQKKLVAIIPGGVIRRI